MRIVMVSLAAFAIFWYFSRSLVAQSPRVEAAAAEQALPAAEPVAKTQAPIHVAGAVAVADGDKLEVWSAARSAQYFYQLPPDDQTWVIETAAKSLEAGGLEKRDLTLHIEELSALRQFAVLERQEVLSPEIEH